MSTIVALEALAVVDSELSRHGPASIFLTMSSDDHFLGTGHLTIRPLIPKSVTRPIANEKRNS